MAMKSSAMAIVILIGIAAALSPGQPGQAPVPGKEAARPALVEHIGADGNIMGREFHRVLNASDWLDLWARHSGKQKKDLEWSESYPKVDFTRCMVVAFFRGKTVNTRGEGLSAVDEVDGVLRVRFWSSGYQTMSLEGQDKGVPAISYGIWVLPRSTKAVVVEENVQDLIGKPPIWKEQARFDAVKE
jgi:hypothetical protein